MITLSENFRALFYTPFYAAHATGAYASLRRTIAERVHKLDQAQASARKIAADTGVTMRTVHRHRAAHRGGPKGKQGSLF